MAHSQTLRAQDATVEHDVVEAKAVVMVFPKPVVVVTESTCLL